MMVVRINGGLGNQLFQYAFGYYLKKTKNVELKLDSNTFLRNKAINYRLDSFNVDDKFVTKKELGFYGVKYGLFKKSINNKERYYRENMSYLYDKKIENIKDNVYFDGFWQCEDYFKRYRSEIIEEFSLKKKSRIFENIRSKIIESNSISIHVRRGDYLIKQNYNAFGLCDIDYYIKSISCIDCKITEPYYFCFSDDSSWLNESIVKNNSNYLNVSKFGLKPEEEMILMSLCKHNIVANSTFSWWGAWLNKNNKKIVIAPEKWRNDGISVGRLLPVNWIKI